MKISGIYKIESKINPERIYIGSAVNMQQRKCTHFCLLRNNKHANIKLQSHFNKYGESDLVFSVLLGCEKNELLANEQFFIDSISPFFNICKIAGNTLGRKWSIETRIKLQTRTCWSKGKKMSADWCKKNGDAHRGIHPSLEVRYKIGSAGRDKKQSPEHIKKIHDTYRKAILQYLKTGEYIKEWDSAINASRELSINAGDICRCLKLKLKSSGGFIWKYKVA